MNELQTKPFLRWAGGKTWLLPFCLELLEGLKFNQYHEPFLGSGTLFFALPEIHKCFLSDLNSKLITTYDAIKNNPNGVVKKLQEMKNEKNEYYRIRKTKYRADESIAAQFIYLNQTSYNGLYRVNRKGEYNVPYGARKLWKYDVQRLCNANLKLLKTDAELTTQDFEAALTVVQENDLVFLDPPYAVSETRGREFCEYNDKIFALEDQRRLSRCIDIIKEKKAYYILTNAFHPEILKIFEKGDFVYEVERSSCIGGRSARRGKVKEYVFTNIRKERCYGAD